MHKQNLRKRLSSCHLEGKINRVKAIHRSNFVFLTCIRNDTQGRSSCNLGIARRSSIHIPYRYSNDGLHVHVDLPEPPLGRGYPPGLLALGRWAALAGFITHSTYDSLAIQ